MRSNESRITLAEGNGGSKKLKRLGDRELYRSVLSERHVLPEIMDSAMVAFPTEVVDMGSSDTDTTRSASRIHGTFCSEAALGRSAGSFCRHKAMKFLASPEIGLQISVGMKTKRAFW
mmetsp:Transcript_50893/g.131207  ORF Transcript_50893/g.131207 Transcript_50893/m.131207 type:complete len:118 (+) Transcript_50893:463-816(+)